MTQALRSATVFSLAADMPTALAAQPAPQSVFDEGCLVGEDTRLPCAIHKLSPVGATLHIDEEIEPGTALTLELANRQTIAGRIDWQREGEAGFLFDKPIDIIGALARNLASQSDERRRVPRVEINQPASVRHQGKVFPARARNISQGGVGLETRATLAVGDQVRVTLDGLRPLDGTVRWIREGQVGIAYDVELGWQVLMPWLRHAQQSPVAAPHTGIGGEPEGLITDKRAIRLNTPAQVRSGVHWWNAKVRAITTHLVELETRAVLRPGAQLWISLPEIGGGPVSVIETAHNRILCEFRLPLRDSALGLLTGSAHAA